MPQIVLTALELVGRLWKNQTRMLYVKGYKRRQGGFGKPDEGLILEMRNVGESGKVHLTRQRPWYIDVSPEAFWKANSNNDGLIYLLEISKQQSPESGTCGSLTVCRRSHREMSK